VAVKEVEELRDEEDQEIVIVTSRNFDNGANQKSTGVASAHLSL
jgi:hypothetical protein